jgi:hypothetical protein
MYHGIIVDQEFNDPSFCDSLKSFDKKKSGSWTLYGIEIEDSQVENTIYKIQQNMKIDEPWYAHLYNDGKLIVIFKDRVFDVKPHVSTWQSIIEYGRKLNIPEEQLDFWPNRFQDEKHYFQNEA